MRSIDGFRTEPVAVSTFEGSALGERMSEHRKNRQTQQVALRLARLEELLVPPEPDPLAGRFEERSGVERILDTLRSQNTGRLDAIEATLVLDEQPTPDVRHTVDTALAALWRHQDGRLGEQLVTIRRDGLRALGKGILFMLVCMAISAIGGRITALPDLVRGLVSEGFIIAGWVALWHPMELLLYEWWPVARDRRLYRLVAAMTYTVETPAMEEPLPA